MAKRTRINRPYPTHLIEEALPIAQAIQDVNSGHSVETSLLARELRTSVTSSAFIQKLNSSSKYNLTAGTNKDDYISLTELGESITASRAPEDRADALEQAAVYPEIFRRFYELYANKRMPEDVYATSTLIRDFGVHPDLASECLHTIRMNGLFVGIISDHSGIVSIGRRKPVEVVEQKKPASRAAVGTEEPEPYNTPPNSGDDSRTVLILTLGDMDEVGVEVLDILNELSLPTRLVNIDLLEGDLVPKDMAAALDSAHGCVFVWPLSSGNGGNQQDWRAWAILGAASYGLGQRLVVALTDSDGSWPSADTESLNISIASNEPRGSFYRNLMSALIQSGTLRIGLG